MCKPGVPVPQRITIQQYYTGQALAGLAVSCDRRTSGWQRELAWAARSLAGVAIEMEQGDKEKKDGQ